MDMWNPYIASVREHLPGADGKIVFDKFHIAQHLGGAVDKVRRKENKILRADGDDTLVGTRYDWLRHPARMEPKDRRAFAALRDSGLKTARAWALKETMMAFFDYRYERPARKHFRWWHNWAVRSRLQPMIEVGRMLKRRFANIVTYLRHRVTNATSESLNAKIQWVKYTAPGFPKQTELRQRHLLPLRRAEPRSLATRMPKSQILRSTMTLCPASNRLLIGVPMPPQGVPARPKVETLHLKFRILGICFDTLKISLENYLGFPPPASGNFAIEHCPRFPGTDLRTSIAFTAPVLSSKHAFFSSNSAMHSHRVPA